MNYIPDLCSSQTTTTRATVSELKDLLNAVINHDSHQAILDIMKRANPGQETHRSSFDYFVSLSKVISKTLFLSIAKMHSGILLNYQTFIFEAGLISLAGTYSQMVLGMTSKEDAIDHARKLHQLREDVKQSYIDYLGLNNPNVLSFLRTVIPQVTFSHAFD